MTANERLRGLPRGTHPPMESGGDKDSPGLARPSGDLNTSGTTALCSDGLSHELDSDERIRECLVNVLRDDWAWVIGFGVKFEVDEEQLWTKRSRGSSTSGRL